MISQNALSRMLSQARTLRRGFAPTAPKPWDGTTAAAELMVQVGHLAQCIGRRKGIDMRHFEDPARPITNTGDELADVALAILSTAILSGDELAPAAPGAPDRFTGDSDEDTRLLLTLIVAAGQLAESTMVSDGYRHRPTENMPVVGGAAGTALAVTDDLATAVGVQIPVAFDTMAADAAEFLAARAAGGDPA